MEQLREPFRFLRNHFQRNHLGIAREVLPLRWKEAILRVVADIVLTNGSMLGAAVIWAVFKPTLFSENPGAIRLITSGKTSLLTYVLLWSVLSIIIFHLHGFYTRTRGYASRYKALVIGRAVSLVIAVFIVIDHFFLLGGFSRAVAVLGWFLMLLSVGGIRLGKDLIVSTYRIELRVPSSSKVKMETYVLRYRPPPFTRQSPSNRTITVSPSAQIPRTGKLSRWKKPGRFFQRS